MESGMTLVTSRRPLRRHRAARPKYTYIYEYIYEYIYMNIHGNMKIYENMKIYPEQPGIRNGSAARLMLQKTRQCRNGLFPNRYERIERAVNKGCNVFLLYKYRDSLHHNTPSIQTQGEFGPGEGKRIYQRLHRLCPDQRLLVVASEAEYIPVEFTCVNQ